MQFSCCNSNAAAQCPTAHNKFLHILLLLVKLINLPQVCLPVPLFHCFGCVLGALAITSHGACMVIPGEGFDPEQTLQAVQQGRCTALYGVPTMFIAQLAHPRFGAFDLSSLRKGIMAGSPCPQDTMEQVC